MPEDSAASAIVQFFSEVPPVLVSVLSLLAIVLIALWWAGRAVENREYVLEQ
jgi:hypothetical protein